MKNINKHIALLLYLIAISGCFSNISHAKQEILKQTGFRHFSTQQGLSQNTINQFYQDKNQFIWIATESGLNRLSGNQITPFSGTEGKLAGEAIHNIIEDTQGALWVSTYSELFKISPDYSQIRNYYIPNYLPTDDSSNYIVNIFEENDSSLWVVSRNGVYLLESKTNELKTLPAMQKLVNNKIKILFAHNDQHIIWLGTNQGLFELNKQGNTLYKHPLPETLKEARLIQLAQISNTQLLLSSDKGALLIDRFDKSSHKKNLITPLEVSSAVTLNNQVFLSIDDQLHTFDMQTHTLKHLFSLSKILPQYANYRIVQLFIDKSQKLWIGTDSNGAYLWEPNSLLFKSAANLTSNPSIQLSNNTVWNFAEDTDQQLWIATDNGLNLIHRNKATIDYFLTHEQKQESTASYSERILFILPDNEYLWLGTDNGLIRFNKSNKNYQVFSPYTKHSKKKFFIYSMTKTPDDDIWIASGNGPIRFNPQNLEFEQVPKLLRSNDSIESTFIRYESEKLWIGYPTKLETFDIRTQTKKTVVRFEHANIDQNLSLTDIYLDKNHLWISFNGKGLYLADLASQDNRIIKHFNRKNGFPDNIVHTLLPQKDALWASTHTGLVQINLSTHQFINFNVFDGLPVNEFNEGASLITQNNEYILGGANGILLFSPDTLPAPDPETNATITSVTIQDKQELASGISWKEKAITLNETNHLMIVNVSVLDYLTPERWQYQYWLTGTHPTQPKISSKNDIVLANLPEGNYQLNIRPFISNLADFENITQLPFTVVKQGTSHFNLTLLIYSFIIIVILIYLYQKSLFQKQLLGHNKQLKEKEIRLEKALISEDRGLWDWQMQNESLMHSTISMLLPNNEKLIITLSQYQTYVHPDHIQNVKKHWLKILNGKHSSFSVEFQLYLFEQWIWCHIQGEVTTRFASGKPSAIIGTWEDISEEKNSQKQLNLFQEAFGNARDIMFIMNSKLEIISVNHAYQNLTGFPSHQLIGKDLIQLARKRLSSEIASELEKQLRKNLCWQGEASMPISGGASYPVDIRIDAFNTGNNEQHFVLIMTDISSLNERLQSSVQSSYYDDLTGLPNQILARDRLSHAITHARLHESSVALVYLDLDKFDFYSQTLGKSAAREILVTCSKRMSQILNKDDTLARLDKDKFNIIFENVDRLENIAFKVSQIFKELSRTQVVNNTEINLTASAGVAYFPHDAKSATNLIECASQAMLIARSAGTNRINFYHREINQRAMDRLAMRSSLQMALEKEEFYLVFQPKFQLANDLLSGFEVFVRWKTQDGNIIYPSQFIKMAEEIGIIEKMTEWLIESSFKTLAEWKKQGINSVFSINLNPKYCQHIGSPQYLSEKLAEKKLSPLSVQIEVNERQFAEDLTRNLEFINALQQKGLNVTLDDFGSGSTPINHLKHLPVNMIKLERNFIRNIEQDTNNDILLKSIIQTMEKLGKTTSAKGIEYIAQKQFLIEAGCQFGQGYLFSDPLDHAQALELAKTKSN